MRINDELQKYINNNDLKSIYDYTLNHQQAPINHLAVYVMLIGSIDYMFKFAEMDGLSQDILSEIVDTLISKLSAKELAGYLKRYKLPLTFYSLLIKRVNTIKYDNDGILMQSISLEIEKILRSIFEQNSGDSEKIDSIINEYYSIMQTYSQDILRRQKDR